MGLQEQIILSVLFSGGTCEDSKEIVLIQDKYTQLLIPCNLTTVGNLAKFGRALSVCLEG